MGWGKFIHKVRHQAGNAWKKVEQSERRFRHFTYRTANKANDLIPQTHYLDKGLNRAWNHAFGRYGVSFDEAWQNPYGAYKSHLEGVDKRDQDKQAAEAEQARLASLVSGVHGGDSAGEAAASSARSRRGNLDDEDLLRLRKGVRKRRTQLGA